MPRTPKKTPQKLAAIRAAREAGLGWRGAGASAGVSAETARSWLAAGGRTLIQNSGESSEPPTWADVLVPVPGLATTTVDAIALRGLLLAVAELEAFVAEFEDAELAGRLCASCPGRCEGCGRG